MTHATLAHSPTKPTPTAPAPPPPSTPTSLAQNTILASPGSWQANGAPPAPAPARTTQAPPPPSAAARPRLTISKPKKTRLAGQVASRSAQLALFSADYSYLNDTTDQFVIYNTTESRPNTYHGSAVQQAVRRLSSVPGTCIGALARCFIPWVHFPLVGVLTGGAQGSSIGLIQRIGKMGLSLGKWTGPLLSARN